MKFKIINTEIDDSIIIDGDTIEEIRDKTVKELDKRGWDQENCHSEQL